jgi:hypothetical protein
MREWVCACIFVLLCVYVFLFSLLLFVSACSLTIDCIYVTYRSVCLVGSPMAGQKECGTDILCHGSQGRYATSAERERRRAHGSGGRVRRSDKTRCYFTPDKSDARVLSCDRRACVSDYSCGNAEIALNCGTMLRDAISKHVEVARLMLTPTVVLQSEVGPDGQPGEPMQVAKEALFFKFFSYVEEANFDIASDAFDTFKLLLTKHKELVKDFLEVYYQPVTTDIRM